jgi:hypothetical protein
MKKIHFLRASFSTAPWHREWKSVHCIAPCRRNDTCQRQGKESPLSPLTAHGRPCVFTLTEQGKFPVKERVKYRVREMAEWAAVLLVEVSTPIATFDLPAKMQCTAATDVHQLRTCRTYGSATTELLTLMRRQGNNSGSESSDI